METKHILDDLHKYMFLQDVYRVDSNDNDGKEFFNKNNLEHDKQENKKNKIFSPDERDQLFWCFYIIKHGVEDYLSIGQNHFQVETQFKIATAEKLSECEIILKQNKLTKRNLLDIGLQVLLALS